MPHCGVVAVSGPLMRYDTSEIDVRKAIAWNLDRLLRRGTEMILHHHVRHTRPLALEPVGSEDEISSPA
jgi:hypothetical protein